MATRQITIRVEEDLLDFVDALVGQGDRASRADAVNRALRRERRHQVAVRDLEIMAAVDGDLYPDLNGLAEWAAQQPVAD
jgi:Arc/MetJ-type ribon-helix-helix transcriptional regulator